MTITSKDVRTHTNPLAKTYLFNWIGGGYNTVAAMNLKEAKMRAKNWCDWSGAKCSLVADLKTVRIPKKGELEALDKYYAGMFD